MKDKTKKRLVFFSSFFLCFLLLYCGITEWREHNLNSMLGENLSNEERNQKIEEFREKEEEYLKSLSFDPPYNDIFTDPLMIDYMSTTFSRIYEYRLQYHEDLLPNIVEEKDSTLSFSKFFHVYGRLYSYENLELAGYKGVLIAASQLGPSSYKGEVFSKMALAILEWEAAGNTREGNWLDEFMQSPQYQTFLTEIFHQIDTTGYRPSIQSMVDEISEVSVEQSRNPLEHLKNHLLQDSKELTEVLFQSYQQHRQEGDFARASVDAEIITSVFLVVADAQSFDQLHYYKIHEPSPFFPNPFVDLAGVFLGAFAISLVVVYLYKKKCLVVDR